MTRLFASIAILTLALSTLCHANVPAQKAQKQVDPATAPLAQAVENWIHLLENDQLQTAVDRWAADEKAAASLTREWADLRRFHAQYDYAKWLEHNSQNAGAKAVGDAKRFKIGGHSFGHRHIDWVRTDAGWRIANVWICR